MIQDFFQNGHNSLKKEFNLFKKKKSNNNKKTPDFTPTPLSLQKVL